MANVRYEASTDTVIDAEAVAPATGWTFGYASLTRIGALVALHVEATFAASAAALVATLPIDLRPSGTVSTVDGKYLIHSDGTVTYPGSTSGGGTAILDVVYQAANL